VSDDSFSSTPDRSGAGDSVSEGVVCTAKAIER